MCKSSNRTGTLCGRCLPDHYPLAYSFNMTCIPCPHARWNWFKYIMAAYLPLTLFYFAVIFFKINTTSCRLFAVVFYCQTITMPFTARSLFFEIVVRASHNYFTSAKIFFSLYGIWNLDFFRPFYTDLCLGIGILPTLALDYVIAVYPLLLMMITYLMITLYDRNCRVIVIMWRPFRSLFAFFRINLGIRTSLIDAFATFFFLSNVKFLSVSFDFLIPTTVYQLHPDHYNHTLGLYYAGDIKYLGKEHLPYAILAIVVLSCCFLLPVTILALYPFKFFQEFINLFPCRWYILHTFVDPFYAMYKNGTQPGTKDFRWCASVFFLLRMCQYLVYSIESDKIVYTVLITAIFILFIILISLLHPFAVSRYNIYNIVFLQFLLLFALSVIAVSISSISASHLLHFFFIVSFLFGAIPIFYFIFRALHWVFTHIKFVVRIFYRLLAWKSGYSSLPELREDLPHRIENPAEYPRENLANFSSKAS